MHKGADMDNPPQYLTEAEAARELRRSPATLTRWRRTRIGPPYTRVQDRILYPRHRLVAWLEARTVEGGAK